MADVMKATRGMRGGAFRGRYSLKPACQPKFGLSW